MSPCQAKSTRELRSPESAVHPQSDEGTSPHDQAQGALVDRTPKAGKTEKGPDKRAHSWGATLGFTTPPQTGAAANPGVVAVKHQVILEQLIEPGKRRGKYFSSFGRPACSFSIGQCKAQT